MRDSGRLEYRGYRMRSERRDHAVERFLQENIGRLTARARARRDRLAKFVSAVKAHEAECAGMNVPQLRAALRRAAALPRPSKPEAAMFAMVRAMCGKTLGVRHYDVQL